MATARDSEWENSSGSEQNQFSGDSAEFGQSGESDEGNGLNETNKNGGSESGSGNLQAEVQDLKDKNLRLYAEFENFRRRTSKENFELIASANAKLIGKLTDVLDNFELAFDPKHKAAKPEDFEKGIKLIFAKFKDILSEEGLTEVNPVGEEFDPNLHEALMQQPSETVPENHVAQVLQKGYKVKAKILKHAKVIVSTGKPD